MVFTNRAVMTAQNPYPYRRDSHSGFSRKLTTTVRTKCARATLCQLISFP